MNTAEMQDEVLREHLLRHVEKCYIRADGVAVVVGIPVLRGLTRHAGSVAMEGVLHVDIDGFAKALQLPVARYGNLVPLTHIIVLALKAYGSALRVFRPAKLPLAVERKNLRAVFPFRRQLQRRMIRQFVDAQHGWVFPVVCLGRC